MGPSTKQIDGIEIDEDIPFQEKMWAFQRGGRLALGLFILAGFLGLLGGSGPLTQGTQRNAALEVTYDRLTYSRSPSTFVIKVRHPQYVQSLGPSEITLSINKSYLQNVTIKSIHPEPTRVVQSTNENHYTFLIEASENSLISVEAAPNKIGRQGVRITSNKGGVLEFSQFALP